MLACECDIALFIPYARNFCYEGAGSIQSKAAAKNAAKRRNRKGKAGGSGGAEGEADDEPDGNGFSAAEAGPGFNSSIVIRLFEASGIPSCCLGLSSAGCSNLVFEDQIRGPAYKIKFEELTVPARFSCKGTLGRARTVV